mgnify:CR=1 FL=1
MSSAFPRTLLPQELIYEFVGTFARCEYALKRSGFARGGATSVEADWNTFASAVDGQFRRVGDQDFKTAVDFLLTEPPRKQVLRNESVDWIDSPPDTNQPNTQQVLLMVRRIRNNLFHGAKVWSPEDGDRERDVKLVEASLVVLKQCVVLNEKVDMAYELGAF